MAEDTSTDVEASGGVAQQQAEKDPAVAKRIAGGQTVCNELNAKGKLCNGHLKQLATAGQPSQEYLRGDDVILKCQVCGTLYTGPPLGHVRDSKKQPRLVERRLAAILKAAGGTLPIFKKTKKDASDAS